MQLGMCARCMKRIGCGFRQPGTWVVECGLYEQDPQTLIDEGPGNESRPTSGRPEEPGSRWALSPMDGAGLTRSMGDGGLPALTRDGNASPAATRAGRVGKGR
jgi:hypothetical protein